MLSVRSHDHTQPLPTAAVLMDQGPADPGAYIITRFACTYMSILSPARSEGANVNTSIATEPDVLSSA